MNGAKTDAIYNGMGNKENLHNILVDNGKHLEDIEVDENSIKTNVK